MGPERLLSTGCLLLEYSPAGASSRYPPAGGPEHAVLTDRGEKSGVRLPQCSAHRYRDDTRFGDDPIAMMASEEQSGGRQDSEKEC
jgi:hypothetical protein